jgi:predicted metalloprotease with PDZ domain
MRRLLPVVLLSLLAVGARAQNADQSNYPGPIPAPMPPPIPAPLDIPYPNGTIQLSVDGTQPAQGIMRVHEVIPVAKSGPLILLYPRWLPGNHSPSGPLDLLAGLSFHAGSTTLTWTRDPVDVYAFHINVPNGAHEVTADFQYLSPTQGNQGRVVATDVILNLEWNAVVLYPAGYFSRRIPVSAELKVPQGWGVGTALEPAGGGRFKTTSLNTLVDSPVLAGKYFSRIDLDPGAKVPVHMDVVADHADQLKVTPQELQVHKNLVQQAYKLYGSHHYDHYDFLLGLSAHVGGEGLEHHQSSEDVTTPKYFTQWDKTSAGRDLLAHEYTHSWNGKFRRPADLWTPNFNVPMRGSLLWVYEGQTQFWGFVLAARSGLWTKQQALDAFADDAAYYGTSPGRQWRGVDDTTLDPIITSRRPIPWRTYQRSEDYYSEGLLTWLDADSLIRQKTNGQKSMDDFAKAFFGVHDGSFVTVTYTFDDVVKALNSVMPYDWAGFLSGHIGLHPAPPLDGIARGGYRLVYTDKPSERESSSGGMRKRDSFAYSLGFVVDNKGNVMDVTWGSPAFKAGIALGAQIIAVDGDDYDADGLKDAITGAKGNQTPVTLLVKRNDAYRTISIPYHDGLRYPHLERVQGAPALLDALITAK